MKLIFRPIELHLAHKWQIARTSGSTTSEVMIVELQDGAGITGLGESSPIQRYNENMETVAAFLRRVNAAKLSFADVPGSMRYVDSVAPGNMAAKCAVNIALVDGAARLAGKAVYDFLGLGFRERHHVTSFTIGIDTPEIIRQKVMAAKDYPILKIKVGVPGDRENMKAVREIAPTKTVRVDANEGWKTKEQALEMIQWLAEDKHVEYVEQPMPTTTPVADMVWLKERSPLPLYGDESYHTAADAPRCAECFHGVNIKLVKTGGISAGFGALSAARKLGLKTMIGCMIETSILISAAAHLAELCDHLDIDGNLLITDDPYVGVTAEKGLLSFASAPEKLGLRVSRR
ncbi:MAG: dipeptide epimerase [Verrucomicrobia bacterium]|nr:dipeptide epimerase [Verrucomicrobiota bacterium]